MSSNNNTSFLLLIIIISYCYKKEHNIGRVRKHDVGENSDYRSSLLLVLIEN